MPDNGFDGTLQQNSFWGHGQKEDILTETELYPLMTDLWENKIPEFDKITVPAYIVGSYSNTLHTQGTFRAWRRIASEDKWLRIHNSQEWPDYYDETNREDLRNFFDHFLKGQDNGWERTPRVRYSLLDLDGHDQTGVAADAFPTEDVVSTKYFLEGRSRTLVTAAPADGASAMYPVGATADAVSFLTRFDEETVLVGYPKAHLWVEARGSDDMDLFVLVQKLDAYGTPLAQFTVPNQSAMIHDATERGGSTCGTRAPTGVCASRCGTSTSTCRPTTYPRTRSTGSRSSATVRSSRSRSTCCRLGWCSTRANSSVSLSAVGACSVR